MDDGGREHHPPALPPGTQAHRTPMEAAIGPYVGSTPRRPCSRSFQPALTSSRRRLPVSLGAASRASWASASSSALLPRLAPWSMASSRVGRGSDRRHQRAGAHTVRLDRDGEGPCLPPTDGGGNIGVSINVDRGGLGRAREKRMCARRRQGRTRAEIARPDARCSRRTRSADIGCAAPRKARFSSQALWPIGPCSWRCAGPGKD
jgi:hypothetical protein